MNREPLSMILVSQGDMYANDALQTICSKIFNYSSSKMMYLLDLSRTGISDEEQNELNSQSKALEHMVSLFDSIVNLGEKKALQFIEANWFHFIGYPFKK